MKVIVINLENNAVSEYTNWIFNSYAFLNGKYYGVNSNGLYELAGNTDAGTAINGKIKTPTIDLWGNERKIPIMAIVTGRNLTATLTVQGDETISYSFPNTGIANMGEQRIKLGRGWKNRFYNFTLQGTNGNKIFLETLHILCNVIKRIVR